MNNEIKPHGGRRLGAGRKLGVPNKLTRDVKALASQYGSEALQTLVRIMKGGESETARIAAAKELLDRGYGRPRSEEDPKNNQVIVHVYGTTPSPLDITALPGEGS